MKILWIKTDFLHPTTRGGQIRTLEMLRRLHARNEVVYVAFSNDPGGEGVRRSREYSSQAHAIPHSAPPRFSLRFGWQLLHGLVDSLPVSQRRYVSAAMREKIAELTRKTQFDSIVCDFLAPAPNVPQLERCVLFQHNVETAIWRRHAATARNPAAQMYLRKQAERMFGHEREVCRKVRHVIAVSHEDACQFQELFGLEGPVSEVPTGVDADFFAAPAEAPPPRSGIVFVGSMDWMPNIDGVRFFVETVLPLIRREHPACEVTIAGRDPGPAIRQFASADPRIHVTGTVPDIRPYLWGSAISGGSSAHRGRHALEDLRIHGSRRTRGLHHYWGRRMGVTPGKDIAIADTPEALARACSDLLSNPEQNRRQAESARRLVEERFSWDTVALQFEHILASHAQRR